jgi:hypothetical protein
MRGINQQGVLRTLRSEGAVTAAAVVDALHVVTSRVALAGIDRDRLIRLALVSGSSQSALARELGMTQARISQIAAVPESVPEGLSGATPLEIAQRYAVGEIDRAQAVEELSRFPYRSASEPSELDDAWEPGPLTWADVVDVHRQGLIDDDMYDDALDGYAARTQ